MSVRGVVRRGGQVSLIAGVLLAIAITVFPAGWLRVDVQGTGRKVYLDARYGFAEAGYIRGQENGLGGETTIYADGPRGGLSRQFDTRTWWIGGWHNIDNRHGMCRRVLGISYLWMNVSGNPMLPQQWSQTTVGIPAWLLALPGVIGGVLRLRRRNATGREQGFEVLPPASLS